MRSPVRALIWEQWRQVWWTVPLSLLVTSLVSIALHTDRDIGWYKELWMLGSGGAVFASLLLAGGLLLFAHSSPTDIRAGIPVRHRTLPISPLMLALSQYLFRIGFVVALALTLLSIVSLTDAYYAPYILPGSILAACGMSLATAIMWTIGTRRIGLAAIVAIVIALATNLAYASAERSMPRAAPTIPAGIILISSFVAIRGSARRNGRTVLRTEYRDKGDLLRGQTTDKRSVVEAQAWFDARRRGQVVWVLAGLIALPILAVFALDFLHQYRIASRPLYIEQYGTTMMWRVVAQGLLQLAMLLLCIPPITALASGVCFIMLDIRDASLHVSNFIFTRPIRTSDVVRARCRFATRAAMRLCVLPFFLSACCVVAGGHSLFGHYPPAPAEFLFTQEYLLVMFLSFAATALMFWSVFPVLLGVAWLAVEGFGLEHVMGMEGLVWTIPAVVAVVAIYRGLKLYRAKLYEKRFLSFATMCSILLWLSVVWLESSLGARFDDEVLFAVSCISALVLYVLFSQPLWIEFLRHGGFSRLGQRRRMDA